MPNTPGKLICNSLIPQTISHHTNTHTQPPDVLLRANLVISPQRVYRAWRQRNLLCTYTYSEISASNIHRERRMQETRLLKNKTQTPESTHNPAQPVFLHESLIISQRKGRWRGDKRERDNCKNTLLPLVRHT